MIGNKGMRKGFAGNEIKRKNRNNAVTRITENNEIMILIIELENQTTLPIKKQQLDLCK